MNRIEMESKIMQGAEHPNTKEGVSSWLWNNLKGVYASPMTREGEQFKSYLISAGSESVFDGLDNIYQQLKTDSQKLLFRQSIGYTLIQHGNEEDVPLDALQDLIYLIGRTKAVESLDALIPTVGNGLFGKKDPDSLYNTIAVMKSLEPSQQIQETMSQLADGTNFDDGYLFEAIIMIAKCNPYNIPTLLLHFQTRLQKFKQTIKELDTAEQKEFDDCTNDFIEKIHLIHPSTTPDTIKQIFQD